jgi:hypothetical protein
VPINNRIYGVVGLGAATPPQYHSFSAGCGGFAATTSRK